MISEPWHMLEAIKNIWMVNISKPGMRQTHKTVNALVEKKQAKVRLITMMEGSI